jgi:alkanesulfonate monooxygenase SsuD/methylene tetrahydromethanopterin reductase-like flavin-dependent oxidoreductase (luciferase family)
MKFSVWPSFARPWDELLNFARHIDSGDFGDWHCLWYADHYMSDRPEGAVSDDPALECWATVGALASTTAKVRLGTLVSPTTVHHPAILAKRAATIDQISGGRFILGMGAGWQRNEHAAYGIELYEAPDRVTRFEEAIQITRMMLHQPRTTFEGRFFSVTDAPCEPKPVQTPLPILVGTSGPRMSRITARWADEWNVWGTPERVKAKGAVIDQALAAEGLEPNKLRRSAQALVFMVDDPAVVDNMRANAPADESLIGGSAQLTDMIGGYKELGIDEFILPDFTLGKSASERMDTFDRFWAEVAVHLV